MRSNPCLPDRPRRTILLLRSLLRKNTTRQSFSPSSSSSSSSLVFCRETTILVSVLMRRIYTTQNTETCGVSRSLCEKTHPFLFRVSNVGSKKKKFSFRPLFFCFFFFCGRLSTKERASRRDPARKETRAHFLISNFQVAGVFSQGKTYLPRKHTRTHERDRTKTKTVVIALVCFCRLSAE